MCLTLDIYMRTYQPEVVPALTLIVSYLGCYLRARDQDKYVVQPITVSINLVKEKALGVLLYMVVVILVWSIKYHFVSVAVKYLTCIIKI